MNYIQNLLTLKRNAFRFSINLILFSCLLFSITNASAQVGFDPNNLSTVKIDDLNDDQILAILKQGEEAGVTIDQAEVFVRKKGMPASEVTKFKERIAQLQLQGRGPMQDAAGIKASPNSASNNSTTSESSDNASSKLASNTDGQEYFRNGDIKIFDKSTDAKAPSNYVIGVGDELGLSVFGYSYYNEVLKVDAKGSISPQQMGPIFVKGLTFEKAKSLIRSKMAQYFDLSNNRVEITLAYSRTITVNIVGEVMKPGSYKLPALNTAFNALILAGGPNDIGTLRNIQIKRDGKLIKTLDVYEFLNNPNSKQDYYLEENDYIIVPNSNKLVKISGQVNRPTQFELKADEGILDLLKYAGGLRESAYKEKIQLIRRANLESKIIEFNLDSLILYKKNFELQNGDVINVRSTINEIINKVVIAGAVNFPGDYGIEKSDKISDLIKKSGGLRPDANLESAYVVRTKQDQTKQFIRINLKEVLTNKNSEQNITIKPLDVLRVYSNKDYIDSFFVVLSGSVRKQGRYDFVSGMTLGDAIQNAGGFEIDAENLRIEISRLSYFSPDYVDGQDVRVTIERIQLDSLNSYLDDKDAQIKLQPYDQIFIRAVPNFQGQQNVVVRGEVKYPGLYPLMSKDDKVSDVIKRAGGLTRYAFTEAATFLRPDLEGDYIVLKLDDVMKNTNSKYNFHLQEGDVIMIPTVQDYVAIRGNTVENLSITNSSQINAPFVKGKRAKFYVNEFGNGFTKNSSRRKTYVIQPNMKVNKTKNFILFKIYPKVTKGSTIYVVEKVTKSDKDKKKGEPINWNKFIESTTVRITGLLTLLILFNQLK